MKIEEMIEVAPGVRASVSDTSDIIIIQNADNFGKEGEAQRKEAMKGILGRAFKRSGYVIFFDDLGRYAFDPVGEDRRYERRGIIPRLHSEFSLGDYLYSGRRINGSKRRLKDYNGVILYSEILTDKSRLCDDLLSELLGKEQRLVRYSPH